MKTPPTQSNATSYSYRDTLIHAVTAYDRKESTKRGYNRNALGIYFNRIDDICADIDAGADPRQAIVAGLSGRLVDHCLRALGLGVASDAEAKGAGAWHYQPVKAAPDAEQYSNREPQHN